MRSLPGGADVATYNLSALLPTLVATSMATGLGVQHLGAHTILRQLMGFWLQVRLPPPQGARERGPPGLRPL